jgi:hypothetical protein
MPLGEAIAAAMRQCIDEGVMADYLKQKGSEVENMLMTEFNIDVAKEVWMEEARDAVKFETALAMIKDGFPIETASKYSGMPVDELCHHIKSSGSLQSPPQ